MNRTRKLAAIAVLAGATTAPACGFIGIGPAAAQAPTACGGEGAMRTIPEGGRAECQTSRVLQDGALWTAHVIIDSDGAISVTYTRNAPAPVDIPIEVEVHLGPSGNGGFTRVGYLPAGSTNTNLAGQVDPTLFLPFDCITQIDVKAINGKLNTPTNRVAIAGPWFQFEDCSPPPTTTAPTTVPVTTVPTSSPATTVPVTSPPPTGGSTTVVRPPSSVAGGTASTLPATGNAMDIAGWAIAASLVSVLGVLLVVGVRRRPAS